MQKIDNNGSRKTAFNNKLGFLDRINQENKEFQKIN